MSIKELDSLLAMLAEKKRKMEQEESERNMKVLTDFLHCLRKQKVNELSEVLFSTSSVISFAFCQYQGCCLKFTSAFHII